MRRFVVDRVQDHPREMGMFPGSLSRYLPAVRKSVGPFILLDRFRQTGRVEPNPNNRPTGELAHPHRGFTTLSYALIGSGEHYDSRGNYISSEQGGVLWMNAGNGIVHDDHPRFGDTPEEFADGFQFWINLQPKSKAKSPDVRYVSSADIPEVDLPDGAGKVRILLGALSGAASPLPMDSEQFLFHCRLEPHSKWSFTPNASHQVAVLIAKGAVDLGEGPLSRELVHMDDNGEILEIETTSDPAELLIFGGEPYTHPTVFSGPFVTNTEFEAIEAAQAFERGDYGTISY